MPARENKRVSQSVYNFHHHHHHNITPLTQLPGGLNVDIVDAAADADDDAQRLELLQVLLGEVDGVPHQRAHRLIEHLLVNLRGGLGVAEGHRRHVLQYGHLHGAVTAVEQGDQRPRVHRPIGNGAAGGADCNSKNEKFD